MPKIKLSASQAVAAPNPNSKSKSRSKSRSRSRSRSKVNATAKAAVQVQTCHTDILMSIKPEHMGNISTRLKNHEYRSYLLPATVRRIWFYTSAPVSSLEYVAAISGGKQPGQVPEDGGIGNADFNAGGKMTAKYGYEILQLWKLNNPVPLAQAKSSGYLKGPPQKYCWLPVVLRDDYPLEEQIHVFAASATTTPTAATAIVTTTTTMTSSLPSGAGVETKS